MTGLKQTPHIHYTTPTHRNTPSTCTYYTNIVDTILTVPNGTNNSTHKHNTLATHSINRLSPNSLGENPTQMWAIQKTSSAERAKSTYLDLGWDVDTTTPLCLTERGYTLKHLTHAHTHYPPHHGRVPVTQPIKTHLTTLYGRPLGAPRTLYCLPQECWSAWSELRGSNPTTTTLYTVQGDKKKVPTKNVEYLSRNWCYKNETLTSWKKQRSNINWVLSG